MEFTYHKNESIMDNRPIFIVDDDMDDQELLEEAWNEIEFKNPLKFFKNAEDVIDFLKHDPTVPFIIISEYTLPKMSGPDLKKKLLETKAINYKSIPFVFLSASASQSQVEQAYDLYTNGFFLKESNFEKLKQQLIDIVMYWSKSIVPVY